jgi:hypothetical protein
VSCTCIYYRCLFYRDDQSVSCTCIYYRCLFYRDDQFDDDLLPRDVPDLLDSLPEDDRQNIVDE